MRAPKIAASPPLYRRSYVNASVLICKIIGFSNAIATVSGHQQLQWLHTVHTSVDDVLRGLSATKVDTSGDTLTFVSGTENGDEKHAASLVGLAQSLLKLCAQLTLPSGDPLRLQMSMHTGEVVSGLVGNQSLKYGVFGVTVSIAKHLQKYSGPGTIVASAKSVKRLADSAGWQPSGTIKLPNNAMLDIYTYSGFNTISKASTSICIAPSMQDKGEQLGHAGHSASEALGASSPPAQTCPTYPTSSACPAHRGRARDGLVLGILALAAVLGALCLALQGRIEGLWCTQHWVLSHAAGEGANFTLAQVAAIVMIWAGAFCVTCLAPMRLYTSARDWTVMALRCALLLQWTSAVTVAMPGAIAGMFSDLLAPWRGQGFVSWAALDFLAAPEPGMPQDLSLLAMLALLSIVLPVKFKAHMWAGFAMISTLLAQAALSSLINDTGAAAASPSAEFPAGLLVLGIGLPALLQAFSAFP